MAERPRGATRAASSRLRHSPSLASTASSSSFQVHTRALRPVMASIISYGRSSKIQDQQISKATTLYVIRVARAGKSWYVARRYSEFRALHTSLESQFVHETRRACAACRELATFYSSVRFPQRFRLRSVFFPKKDIEPVRMEELNQYLGLLIETTQGLLDDDDNDDGAVKCEAMAMVRDFLMVGENEDPQQQHHIDTEQQQEQIEKTNARTARRSRLSSRSASVSSFRVHELDVLYKEKESGCISRFDSLASPGRGTTLSCDFVFDDVFGDFPSPSPDAIVQRQ